MGTTPLPITSQQPPQQPPQPLLYFLHIWHLTGRRTLDRYTLIVPGSSIAASREAFQQSISKETQQEAKK